MLTLDGEEPEISLRSFPSPPRKLTFDLFHFILEGHRAPPLGGASAVGGRLVIRHTVF